MGATSNDPDYKWLELQIKNLATTLAGMSGEWSSFKKDLHSLSDRLLIIETQRETEKDNFNTLVRDIDKRNTTLLKKINENDEAFKKFKSNFSFRKILTIFSLSIGIVWALIRVIDWLITHVRLIGGS